MSGVIDTNGQQWEHCNRCGKLERMQLLNYEPGTPELIARLGESHKYGWDLCDTCQPLAHVEAAMYRMKLRRVQCPRQ